jgi:hypothetical protein
MDRIDEEPTLKDASVRELLDAARKKLGMPHYGEPFYEPVYTHQCSPPCIVLKGRLDN